MATYVKFQLEDGTIVYVETADSPKGSSGLIPAGRGEHAEPAVTSFDKSIEAIRKMAGVMIKNLREGFTNEPDEVQVNFGLKASGDLGNLFVARGGAEANYNVMLRWRKAEEAEKSDGKAKEPEKKKEE